MAVLAGLALGSGTRPEAIDWFVLDGGPNMAGFLGVDYALQNADGDQVEEEICLRLKGGQNEMHAVMRQVSHALRAAREPSASEYTFLRLYSAALQADVYARVIRADFKVQPNHLTSKALGSFSLVIRLLREKRFVGDERKLDIFNSSGLGDSQGLTLYNHDDATIGHDNWFSVQNSILKVEKPCPMRLVFNVPHGEPTLGDFYVGSLLMPGSGSVPGMSIEAENGSGGTSYSDTQASNGKFQRYSWNGTGWATLGTWSLNAMMVSKLSGQYLMPLLRLHNTVSQKDVRLRWVLKQQGKLIFEGPVCFVKAGRSGQAFPALTLGAPGLPLLNEAAGMTLSLEGMQSGLMMSLDVDDFTLLPLRTYRFYQSVSGLEGGSRLVDDTWRGLSWSLRSSQELKTHLTLGEGHFLLPGVEQRFFVFMRDLGDKSAIDLTMKVQAWYRPVVEIP